MVDEKGTQQTQPQHPPLVETRSALRGAIDALRRQHKSIGLVPTMGALHEGHLSLVDASRNECDATIVTIFVNPAQFGPEEDLAQYPRRLNHDLSELAERGTDLVFAPAADEMYRPGHETYVEVGPIAELQEGAARPGHFRGVATVVLKLFHLVPADVAFFGRKDYQQTLVVKQLVDDFDLPIQIRACPIVREPDGLAMSSRNAYLSEEQRRQASVIPESLRLAEQLVESGERDAATIQQRVIDHLRRAEGVEPEYVALVRDGTMTAVARVQGPTVVTLAAKVGRARLIDNWLVGCDGT